MQLLYSTSRGAFLQRFGQKPVSTILTQDFQQNLQAHGLANPVTCRVQADVGITSGA